MSYSLDHKQTVIWTEQILELQELYRHLYFFSYSKARVNLKIQETKAKRPAAHCERERQIKRLQDQSLDSAPPSPSSLSPKYPLSHNLLPSHCAITHSILHPPSSILHPPSSIILLRIPHNAQRTTHNSHLTSHSPSLSITPTHNSLLPARAPHLASPRLAASRPAMRVIPNPESEKHPRRPDIANTPRDAQPPPQPPPLSPHKKKKNRAEKKKSADTLRRNANAAATRERGRGSVLGRVGMRDGGAGRKGKGREGEKEGLEGMPLGAAAAVRCGALRCGALRCGAVRCGAVRCSFWHLAFGSERERRVRGMEK